MNQLSIDSINVKYYTNKDFTEESISQAYKNISDGLIVNYLKNKHTLENQFPIIKNTQVDIK